MNRKRNLKKYKVMAGFLLPAVAFAPSASAQVASEAELVEVLNWIQQASALELLAQRRAAISAIPSGFGLSGGNLSLSASGTYGPERSPDDDTDDTSDASTAIAFGLGDPVTGLGVEFGVVLTSFRDFGASGFMTLGVNRQFSFEGGVSSISVSASNLGAWGDAEDSEVSYSVVGSVAYGLGNTPMVTTLGYGTSYGTGFGFSDDDCFVGCEGFVFGVGAGLSEIWAVSAGVVGDHSILGATYFAPTVEGLTANLWVRDAEDSDSATFGVDLGFVTNLFGG
jgi:hypothetical protein